MTIKQKSYNNYSDLSINLNNNYLNKKSIFLFNINLDKKKLKKLSNFLNLDKIKNFICYGEIEKNSNNNFKFKCFISCTIFQKCVVSMETVKNKISKDTKRTFIFEKKLPSDEDIDFFESNFNVGDIIIEILSLEIPDYPRLPGKKFTELTIDKHGVQKFNNEKINPFSILRKLK